MKKTASDVPRVSIGLPVYNGENYLAEALDTLLAQTFTDFELIISDNGSQDGTEEICRCYADRDRRVRYFREESNRGCAWNYNRVLELARGEYFTWAAHDDIWDRTFLARTVEVLDEQPSVLRCFCRYSLVDATGRLLEGASDISFVTGMGSIPARNAATPRERVASILFSDSGEDIYALMRTDVLKRTGRYGAVYGSEKVLISELSMRGQYHEIPETLFFSRAHAEASGCITTAAGLQDYIDPKSRRRFAFIRLRLLAAHFQAIWSAPLGLREKIACFGQLVRYTLQWSKWKRVFTTAITGTGNGGGYLKFVRDDESPAKSPTTDQQTEQSGTADVRNRSPVACGSAPSEERHH